MVPSIPLRFSAKTGYCAILVSGRASVFSERLTGAVVFRSARAACYYHNTDVTQTDFWFSMSCGVLAEGTTEEKLQQAAAKEILQPSLQPLQDPT